MASVRAHPIRKTLFFDYRFCGERFREYTTLSDTAANRQRMRAIATRIAAAIENSTFDRDNFFGAADVDANAGEHVPHQSRVAEKILSKTSTPQFAVFAETWFAQKSVEWRRSYIATERSTLNRHLLPAFGEMCIGEISRDCVLAFRARLAQTQVAAKPLSHRRVNAIMKTLRQILAEATERFELKNAAAALRPLKVKRTDVRPFQIPEVKQILSSVRADYRNYLVVRFFTGLRSGEANGLKWKHIDFERRLILIRETHVLGQTEYTKTDSSQRDVQMSTMVYEALEAQRIVADQRTMLTEYVFCNLAGKPVDNKNFTDRVWKPLLRFLGLDARRPYQMRHTAATLWLASGEAPEWCARQLGHTTTEMLFKTYSRYVPNYTRRDGALVDQLIESRLGTLHIDGKG